jgi:alkaline phosphatase
MNTASLLALAAALGLAGPALAQQQTAPTPAAPAGQQPGTGVIFFHPDGTGLNHWNALRMLEKGPDGELHWDKLPAMAVYAGHTKDSLTGTSHGGATIHAYGVKVQADSYGLDGRAEITAASGQKASIAEEAMANGRAVGLIQSGHIAEPGTGAFVASVERLNDTDGIAKQVMASGAPSSWPAASVSSCRRGLRGATARAAARTA